MTGNYIVSFMGFLPADNPKVIVYVAVDNPKGITQYGGTVAAPIARSILIDAIQALNIEKSDGGTEKEYQWYDKKYYTVNDVVGLTVSEAKSNLKNFTIEYTGTGNKVLAISPSANSRITEGSTVRLYLGN